MTVRELILKLSEHDLNADVMILDGFNSGGCLRELNFGPVKQVVSLEDSDETIECKGRQGDEVVALGYGCY
jgi:hypothetical protein